MEEPDVGRCSFLHLTIDDAFDIGLCERDMRRAVRVMMPNPHGMVPPDDDPEFSVPLKKAADILARYIDQLPPQAVAIEVDQDGALLFVSTNRRLDIMRGSDHFLLQDYRLPPQVAAKMVLRSDLTEIGRLGGCVDLVSYPEHLQSDHGKEKDNCHVFKYSVTVALPLWKEVQVLARLPHSPHLALLDRLVLDEITGSKVVEFTMRHMANPTLNKHCPRLRLEWLRQLMGLVDMLNLEYGLLHQDIAARNLIIDPATDSIVLIDFNTVARVGVTPRNWRGCEEQYDGCDDVKGVVLFLYQMITRDPALGDPAEGGYDPQTLDEKDFISPAKWAKHPDVELDSDVADFYFELMAWVRRRRAAKPMRHYTEAPKHLDWPDIDSYDEMAMEYIHCQRYSAGLPYLDWRRPAKHQVDPNRRLLATGCYADEEETPYIAPQKPQPAPATSSPPAAAAAPTSAANPARGNPPRRSKRTGTAAAKPNTNNTTAARQVARRAPSSSSSDDTSAFGQSAKRSPGVAVGRRGKRLPPQQQQDQQL
jgi:hypothetical protein